MASSSYASIRASIDTTGKDSRVEVNQRALIDKILARYASAGAVYRELIQNSNDAEASLAEIEFTTTTASPTSSTNSNSSISQGQQQRMVSQVVYRNNGLPFSTNDWKRLQKIAEGNPNPDKVGAFGVGAYTMFSICEEPMVISQNQALCFVWKGDALWAKVGSYPTNKPNNWTTFVLPSRDPYVMPDLVEFGQFLCASLTFTQHLKKISVSVDQKLRLEIYKKQVQSPTVVEAPKSTSWWKQDGATTVTPRSVFSLKSGAILESKQDVSVVMYRADGSIQSSSTISARYVSGVAKTRISPEMARRMERVTKKQPPKEVTIQILMSTTVGNGQVGASSSSSSGADQITSSFRPLPGKGRIFIGFRTSQTTGLAAHLAAPLIPTVEREAIDLQDATLRLYNVELLECSGIILRLLLEHGMLQIGEQYMEHYKERQILREQLLLKQQQEDDETSAKKSSSSQKQQGDDGKASSKLHHDRSLFSFAKFMAKGVVNALSTTVDTIMDVASGAGDNALLNPKDPLPLSQEEQEAILLMKSFCPQQSTPDPLVGTALAQGFSRCLAQCSPPVLTETGVLRGQDASDLARLPRQGMEAFCHEHVIRKIVYENSKEYHDVLCQVQKLSMDDLVKSISKKTLKEEEMIRLLKWWNKFIKVEQFYIGKGSILKDSIRFQRDNGAEEPKRKTGEPSSEILSMQNYLYYVNDKKLQLQHLPLPETTLAMDLQDKIGKRVLSSLDEMEPGSWFMDLPMDIWAQFIALHSCMTRGQPEEEMMRIRVLALLCREWQNRNKAVAFGHFLKQLLENQRCLPFDSSEPLQYAAERPRELYLNSAELKAFDGISSSSGTTFLKVSQSLKDHGITDDFLITLGVRKSVNIDFLFSHLDTLRWSHDPKPLIEYLRTATLTREDVQKLKSTQYLPAENDVSRTFAPPELYLPTSELRLFPFCKILQWPSDDVELTPKSANGKFLTQKLGVQIHPPLVQLLGHVAKNVEDHEVRVQCLNYIVKQLGPSGVYEHQYAQLRRSSSFNSYKVLPCLVYKNIFAAPSSSTGKIQAERVIESPNNCYSNAHCIIMGLSVLDPKVNKASGNQYGSRFQCPEEPDRDLLLSQLMHLVATGKSLATSNDADEEKRKQTNKRIVQVFDKVFAYLSTKSILSDAGRMASLKKQQFIPFLSKDSLSLEWLSASEVYFKNDTQQQDGDSLTESLFHVVAFSPFLAAAGVKSEASTQDLFRLMLADPQKLLKLLKSEEKYRSLLRRIAANPPFRRITPEIRETPFLLAYKIVESEKETGEKRQYLLAKASDIYIIDNSHFGRMFPVIRAPQESDLENFYVSLGSRYISKEVSTRFEVLGGGNIRSDTLLTTKLQERLEERRPLLVSPSVTSRPLVKNASQLLDKKNLELHEVDGLKAIYTLGKSVKRNQRTTCCSTTKGKAASVLYVTSDFDWFDVGYAIGNMILERCQLEDAFFIGSILEAPLEQLRSRGFPVDRIISAPPEPEPEPTPPPPPPPPAPKPQATASSAATNGANSGPRDATKGRGDDEPDAGGDGGLGIQEILKQMFPDCDESYIFNRLGPNPSMDDVRKLADEMATTGSYPKKTPDGAAAAAAARGQPRPPKLPEVKESKPKKSLSKRLGKALSGFRGNPVGGNVPPFPGGRVPAPTQPTHQHHSGSNDGKPVSAESDGINHSGMQQMLKNAVGNSTKVNSRGVHSEETVMTQIPEGISRHGDGCEIIPAQSLKPFSGPYRSGKTHNGIRVFYAKKAPESEKFLEENFHAVDSFADVLQQLCTSVYDLDISCTAIFYDPTGGTIAFNSNRSLHFNVRFFFALHYKNIGKRNSSSLGDCYSYWFTTMAHELAHHLVSGHNKEHGFYTESYVTMYLPKLYSLLKQMERSTTGQSTETNLRSKFN